MALHLAMRTRCREDESGCAVQVLAENSMRLNVFKRGVWRPLDVAAERFADMEKEDGEGSNSSVGATLVVVDQCVRRETWQNLHATLLSEPDPVPELP